MENAGNKPPKTGKNRAQKPAQGQICQHAADHKSAAAAGADVRPADPKGQHQPGIKAPHQKQQVGKGGVFGSQRAQKTVVQTGQSPQTQSSGKVLQRLLRGHHWLLRPQKRRFSLGSS